MRPVLFAVQERALHSLAPMSVRAHPRVNGTARDASSAQRRSGGSSQWPGASIGLPLRPFSSRGALRPISEPASQGAGFFVSGFPCGDCAPLGCKLI
jgi:hypothetical protein